MAFVECNCFSEVLGVNVSLWVVLPQATTRQIGMKGTVSGRRHPTLYLLHGLSDDHTIWLRRTSIERYASERGLAVVMPAVGRSFYADMVWGYDYWTYISEEVIALAEQFFPLSPRRQDRFVAGLSMGGYGAFKLALRCPDTFAAGASLSGALDMAHRDEKKLAADMKRDFDMVYGGIRRVKGSDNDLLHVASRLMHSAKPRPKLYAWCGTEDFLIGQNRSFRDHARAIGLPLRYEESPGDHQWKYWDEKIQTVLDWLPLRKG